MTVGGWLRQEAWRKEGQVVRSDGQMWRVCPSQPQFEVEPLCDKITWGGHGGALQDTSVLQ